MQNMKIFLEYVVKYVPEELHKFGISEVDDSYQKIMDMVGGEDKFSDFLMGFLNLLYEDFDMYFFKRFTEPSLLYHISRKEADLKKLIEYFYAGKVEIGPKDLYLSKLKGYEKEKVLKVLETFITLGNLAPEVYKHYERESVLDEREKEIREKYPVIRQAKRVEEKYVNKAKTEKSSLGTILKLIAWLIAVVVIIYLLLKLL